MPFDHASLKARHREVRDDWPESLNLRIHRALSWLNRAEQEAGDDDARFVFLWIAFNAAYAEMLPEDFDWSETRLFNEFIHKLVELDQEKLLYELVWDEFPKTIRLLIDNRFVFQPFWDFHGGRLQESQWEDAFALSKRAAHHALGSLDTVKVLGIVFNRLYVLRNQLVHGGATWNSSVNRDQVRQSADLMGRIVPMVIHLMMEQPGTLWGEPHYPVVKSI